MKVANLFSGGKDSVFALFWSLSQGFEPILVTVKPREYSMMFHHPNIDKTAAQAKAMRLKQIFVRTDGKDELFDLECALKKLNIEGIVTGAIESEYQKQRIDKIGEILEVPTYSPLWHKKEGLMSELLDYFEIYIDAVSAEGLGKEWLGRTMKELNEANIPNIHPFLEGGEGETFVCDTPFFKKKLKILDWKKKWDGVRGVADITKLKLIKKKL